MTGGHLEGGMRRLSIERPSFKGPSPVICKDPPNYSLWGNGIATTLHILPLTLNDSRVHKQVMEPKSKKPEIRRLVIHAAWNHGCHWSTYERSTVRYLAEEGGSTSIQMILINSFLSNLSPTTKHPDACHHES